MIILLLHIKINTCNLIFDYYLYYDYKEVQTVNLLPALQSQINDNDKNHFHF